MSMPILLLLLFILALMLAICADWIVKGAAYLARELHMRSFIFGFLFLGAATSVPELFVAIQAVRDNVPQIAVGNLLGGSILLLALVLGASAVALKKIILDHGMTVRDIIISALAIGSPAIALWDGRLDRSEGLILLLLYLFHVIAIDREQHPVHKHIERHARHVRHAGHAILLCTAGLIGMAISAHYFVLVGNLVANALHFSPFVIGLLLLTAGTNLPELMLAWEAISQHKRDIAFGDILGSAVFNTPILGIVCLFSPFSVTDTSHLRLTLILLAAIAIYFLWASSSRKDITRREGFGLLLGYAVFLILELGGF